MTQMTLSDGRALEYLDNGVDGRRAIVFHHGTPSDANVWASWLTAAKLLNVRALAYSRAGYGRSARHRGRSVADNNADLAQLLEKRAITDFVAIGWSGGGPHALAAGLDARCRGIISLAGVAASGVPDLDFLDGMGPENHDEFGAAQKGEAALSDWMERNGVALRSISGEQLREAFGGLIGEADRAVLTGSLAEEMAGVMRSALATSFCGWIDDDLAFVRPWGFDLERLSVPVLLWQGDQDFMVPQAHARWLAQHVPGSRLSFVPGHGHISLVVAYRGEILAQVRELMS
jgi:pimeloyl-ACP methyl ester carboxylesterase